MDRYRPYYTLAGMHLSNLELKWTATCSIFIAFMVIIFERLAFDDRS